MTTNDLLGWGGRVLFGLSATFLLVAALLVIASVSLCGFALYRRDGELLQASALLGGAALFGILIAGAGIVVSRIAG